MSAKTGMNRHYQNHIAERSNFFYRTYRRFGIKTYSSCNAEIMQFIDEFFRLSCGFNMKSYMVNSGLDKRLGIFIRLGYHKVGIENHFAVFTEFCNYRRAKRNVRHEMTIHNIQVHNIYASRFNFSQLISQPSKISA